MTPDDEEALADGCPESVLGNQERALDHLEKAVHLADGALLAGFLALSKGRLNQAEACLVMTAHTHGDLGRHLSKYGICARLSLPITEQVSAQVGPDLRGALLGLMEVYQRQARPKDAIACLERLRGLEPDDVVLKSSLAELLLEAHPDDTQACRRVVGLAQDIENETPIHATLMLYHAKALRRLGLANAARDTLTAARRRKKGRSDDLPRALANQDLKQDSRALAKFEKLYAEDTGYEDVAERLGL